MSELKQEFGDSVILLTFHVDYWDSLGWKDTFSDPRWTERQKMYGQAFSQSSIYTPEMVIDGDVGFNGADGRRAQDEVSSRLSTRKGSLDLALIAKSAKSIELSIHLTPELAKLAKELLAVIVEDDSPVYVRRGENRGETMSGDFAVRAMRSVSVGSGGQAHVVLALPSGVDPARSRVAILVRGESPKIISAQSIPWLTSAK